MRHDLPVTRAELPAFEWWSTFNFSQPKGEGRVVTTWYWHLRARNGEIIAQGEGYATKRAVLRAIATVKRNAATAGVRDGR